MTHEPQVSIIIPAFNAALFIESTIQYIQSQTCQDWELIIVDDCSTDNTFSIVQKHAREDSRIVAIKRDRAPKGSLTCRNIGIEHAKGKYLIHFDSDDIIESFCLEQRIEFMEQNPSIDYATFPGESIIRTNSKIIKTGKKWGLPPVGNLLDSFLSVQYPFSVWNNIYRASKFKDIFWDEKVKIYTDFSFIVPIILSGFTHAFANEKRVDYLYCIGNASAMTSNFISEEKFDSTIYLFQKTIDALKGTEKTQEHIDAFKPFFLLQMSRVFCNGNWEQAQSFYHFTLQHYPKHSSRLTIAKKLISFFRCINLPYRRMVNPVFVLLFNASKVPGIIKNKLTSVHR